MSDRGFYIGYQPEAPSDVGSFTRRVVWALLILVVAVGAAVALTQDRFDPGAFEFGVVRSFEGTIQEHPYPSLLVQPPGVQPNEPSAYLLVGIGKQGAAEAVSGLDGRRVRLEGTLIYRDGETLVELVDGSVEPTTAGPSVRRGFQDLGVATLSGEIVDSKCFYGVMKPGDGKPHRSCAALCILGGVPPVFRVETPAGDFRHYLLVDEAGEPLHEAILDWVAEPLTVSGRVSRSGELYLLAADPATYVRIED